MNRVFICVVLVDYVGSCVDDIWIQVSASVPSGHGRFISGTCYFRVTNGRLITTSSNSAHTVL